MYSQISSESSIQIMPFGLLSYPDCNERILLEMPKTCFFSSAPHNFFLASDEDLDEDSEDGDDSDFDDDDSDFDDDEDSDFDDDDSDLSDEDSDEDSLEKDF